MSELSINYILIRSLPESLVILLSGMLLLGIKINIKELIIKSLVLAAIVGCIRIVLPISFGVHTILAMIALGVMLYNLSNKNLINTTITTCIILISLALSESIYILIANGIIGIPLEILMDNQSIQGALLTLPSLVIVFLIVSIFKYIQNKIRSIKSRG